MRTRIACVVGYDERMTEPPKRPGESEAEHGARLGKMLGNYGLQWSPPAPQEAMQENVRHALATAGGHGIFISYRRSDQPAMAGRLYDKLEREFGADQVFMDVDSIDLGLDFVQVLERSLSQCKALVVVIGAGWVMAKDEYGSRRLDDPDDFVRLEIETALRREIRVIPILVDGTLMPRARDLPEALKPLVRRNGREISNARFNPDCLELVSTLKRIVSAQAKGQAEPVHIEVESNNEFNTVVAMAIRQAWAECFEAGYMEHKEDIAIRVDGGVDGMIWAPDDSAALIAFKTFPSLSTEPHVSEIIEALEKIDYIPCVIVYRVFISQATRTAIRKSHTSPVRFVQWMEDDDNKAILVRHLRSIKEYLDEG
jgi:hypothetical protein